MLLLMEIYMHYRNSINPHDVICKIVYSASKHPGRWMNLTLKYPYNNKRYNSFALLNIMNPGCAVTSRVITSSSLLKLLLEIVTTK